jgi:hypothetical protein
MNQPATQSIIKADKVDSFNTAYDGRNLVVGCNGAQHLVASQIWLSTTI